MLAFKEESSGRGRDGDSHEPASALVVATVLLGTQRKPANAAGTGTRRGLRPARDGHSVFRLDLQRLYEAVQACGYDARHISKHFGISLRHLQRWFAAHMSCSPRVWLMEQRLQRARQLLASSNSVKEVAYSLGFKQPSQFSRDFKRRFGYQPSAEPTRVQPDTVATRGSDITSSGTKAPGAR